MKMANTGKSIIDTNQSLKIAQKGCKNVGQLLKINAKLVTTF
jgi:hypothetical protein